MPKTFANEPFCVLFQKNSGSEKDSAKDLGGIESFRRKFFCLEVPTELVGEHFCAVFQRNSSDEKLYG